jgi:hypothetical protein
LKIRIPIHPVLLGIIPVLLYYLHNIDQAQTRDVLLSLAVSASASIVIWALCALIGRNIGKAALIDSLFLVLFFSFGHAFRLFKGFAVGSLILGRTRFLLIAWALVFLIGVIIIVRSRKEAVANTLTPLANAFALAIVLLSLAQIGFYHLLQPTLELKSAEAPKAPAPKAAEKAGTDPTVVAGPDAKKKPPDIYYIVPDSYEGEAALKTVFDFDNRPFTDYLRKKGFFVASNSHSNYAFTALFLPSSLNMKLLGFISDSLGKEYREYAIPGEMLRNNQVVEFLKSKGYTIINSGSWWGLTAKNRNADINFQDNLFNEFNLGLLGTTVLMPFIDDFTDDELRSKVLFTFDKLSEIPLMEEPTFTIAHIICPHPPYVFGPDGGKLPTVKRVISKADPRGLYRDQVIFMNMRLRQAVEKILALSKTPPHRDPG